MIACAAAAAQLPGELGPAPRRVESQDTSNWVHVPKSALARDSVVTLYRNQYLPGATVALNWTGSIDDCDPGTTNLDHQQAVIGRVNYFRALVGLPAVQLFGGTPTDEVQAAALMMSANNALSHFPPSSWECYTSTGATGASSANIALGVQGVGAIDEYMDDFGDNNFEVGHRRWVLFPPRATMSTGDVAGTSASAAANALYVFGSSTTRPATPEGIAWPPAGFVPYQNLPLFSNRWSFSFPGADFSSATVTLTGPGGAIAVTQETVESGFGDNTIVFRPSGIAYQKPAVDTNYQITVSGIGGTGVPATMQYQVTVIDPDAPTVSSPANYQGLWWASPPGSQSGWGINFAHQGDIIFATWFTYDTAGNAWWLSMTATRTGANTYGGDLLTTHGPPYLATPFDPNAVTRATVGHATLTFTDLNTAQFSYTVNGIAQVKTLTRELFGTAPSCAFGTQPNLALATNYQDLWWAAPAGIESGWGINLTEQSNEIFGTWFTYDVDGSPLWLSVLATNTAPGVYSGSLMRTHGPAFSAVPFDPAQVTETPVGTATFTFSDGAHATFAYTVNGVSQAKAITREVFVSPGTYCQ